MEAHYLFCPAMKVLCRCMSWRSMLKIQLTSFKKYSKSRNYYLRKSALIVSCKK